MGCCGGSREKGAAPEHTAKFAFLTLNDFRCTSAWTVFAYIWLWAMALVAVAVFGLDTFTAVNLLFFNKWSSSVQPALPFEYSRWIFAGCIMLSWVLYVYEWQRAIRVIRRGGVAESYLDPLAVSLQSMRPQGWRRFLVFTELTKSRKRVDYVALFVYFSFQGAVRVVLAEGPRQAINAMSLYAVLQADVLTPGQGDHSAIVQFWLNLESLAEQNREQVAIYFSMLATLIIWAFSALSLIIAAFMYILFLWHYIPARDGHLLGRYCRRKIDKRLETIVESKVKAALAEEERLKQKAERKELKRQQTDLAAGIPLPSKPKIARQPTLPQLDDASDASESIHDDEKLPEMPLARHDTTASVATLPAYSSQPPTRNGSTAAPFPGGAYNRPGMPPTRMNTQSSAGGWSTRSGPGAFNDNAPLLANAGPAGEPLGRLPSVPPQAFDRQNSYASSRGGPPGSDGGRSFTPLSRTEMGATNWAPPPTLPPHMQRSFTPAGPPPPRGDNMSPYPFSPVSAGGSESQQLPFSPVSRMDTTSTNRSYTPFRPGPPSLAGEPASGVPPPRSMTPASAGPASMRAPPPDARSATPASATRPNAGFDFGLDTAPVVAAPRGPTPQPQNARRQNSASSTAAFSQYDAAPPVRQQTPAGGYAALPPPSTSSRPMIGTNMRTASSSSSDRSSNNSYEMTTQPSRPPARDVTSTPVSAGGTSGYTAFNPNMRSAAATPAPRAVKVEGGPGTDANYFGHVRDASMRSTASAGPPIGGIRPGSRQAPNGMLAPPQAGARVSRASTLGYGDILDDYGDEDEEQDATPSDHHHQGTYGGGYRR